MARVRNLLIIGIVALAALPALAGATWNQSRWTGVAIDGADPVAYFTQGRAVEGSRKFTHRWMSAKWRARCCVEARMAARRRSMLGPPVLED